MSPCWITNSHSAVLPLWRTRGSKTPAKPAPRPPQTPPPTSASLLIPIAPFPAGFAFKRRLFLLRLPLFSFFFFLPPTSCHTRWLCNGNLGPLGGAEFETGLQGKRGKGIYHRSEELWGSGNMGRPPPPLTARAGGAGRGRGRPSVTEAPARGVSTRSRRLTAPHGAAGGLERVETPRAGAIAAFPVVPHCPCGARGDLVV